MCQVPGCAKRYTDPSSLRKHVKSHTTKEQQQRKKVDLSIPLICFIFHPSYKNLDVVLSHSHNLMNSIQIF